MNTQIVQHATASGNSGFGAPPATMSSREIAKLTAKRHDHVKRDIEKMLADLEEDAPSFGAIYFDTMNRQQIEYMLDRELTETLLTGYSASMRRRVIRRWRELEASVSTPAVAPILITGKVVGELAIMECFTRMLRPAPSSQLAMLSSIATQNGLDPAFLPGYAVDTAPDAAGGSSLPTKPLSDLLREHRAGYGAAAYNRLLKDVGVLELRQRSTTNLRHHPTGIKTFWSISESGLRFGKNITSPASPRETQPHWYAERFAELHALVLAHLAGRAHT